MKRPYIITQLSLVTYDGQIIPVEIIGTEILDKPLRSIKEKVINAFSTMRNRPVDVKLKVKYI